MRDSLWIGLGVGVATGLWMWAEYALGLHTVHADVGRVTGFFSIVFPVAGMIWALRRVRTKAGRLTFRTGLPHALLVSVAAALAMAVMSTIYIMWLNPQWLTQTGMSAVAFVLQGAVAALIGGIVVGLIALAIMRTRESKKVAT